VSRRALALTLALGLVPSSAAAFDTFDSFGAPVLGVAADPPEDPPVEPTHGGGDGRYFTGSISDGFSCAVCHFGGVQDVAEVEVEITPDPFEDGYIGGDTYEILITGPSSWAATLEFVDAAGEGVGDLELVPVSAQTDADRCVKADPTDPDVLAAHIVTLTGPPGAPWTNREVAGVDACGAEQLRATWVAPETSAGPLWINASVVLGDNGLDASGDRTVPYARMVPPFGTAPEGGRVTNGCATSRSAAFGWPGLAFLASALLWARRRRAAAGNGCC